MPSPLRDACASILGGLLVLAALVIIWADRLSVNHDVYVSELGATGAPTAHSFEAALLLIVAGGSLIAFAGRDVRSRLRLLAVWTPAVSLWISCGFFLVASQVTCTAGCPVPYGPSFDWQDLTHIFCATAAFIVACWGMLQASFADGHRILARFSLAMGIAVGVVAGVGGILSLANFETDFGSRLELVATTLAVLWVAVYGIVIAARRIRDQRAGPGAPDDVADISSSSRLASPTST